MRRRGGGSDDRVWSGTTVQLLPILQRQIEGAEILSGRLVEFIPGLEDLPDAVVAMGGIGCGWLVAALETSGRTMKRLSLSLRRCNRRRILLCRWPIKPSSLEYLQENRLTSGVLLSLLQLASVTRGCW